MKSVAKLTALSHDITLLIVKCQLKMDKKRNKTKTEIVSIWTEIATIFDKSNCVSIQSRILFQIKSIYVCVLKQRK